MPRSALAPRSSCDSAATASTRLGGVVERSIGTELMVSSHDDAAERMARLVVRWVRRLRSECRVARGSSPRFLFRSAPPALASAADADISSPFLLFPPLCFIAASPSIPSSRPRTSSSIPSKPTRSLPTSAAQRGTTAWSSAPIRPISSWHDCVRICSCRAREAMRCSSACSALSSAEMPSFSPATSSSAVGGGAARARLR
mmetsp:Transcript_48083/g.102286  ORF Transcript_48083/g.102286 Transcript_48083/m.102286 type:complete len:201 (+) Transcript_48083:562-1164(+)